MPKLKTGTILPTPADEVTLRLDVDVVQKFKASGDGWQTRINEALKSWMQTHA